ncbi:hypothetical protein ACFSKL_16870 [Belliella marina]|uniref:Lipocalin-like domain-containing protein n=1 Tax=Belliella marina TaxID=1644146 RepID=A0ABW4VRU7_9BACT
MKISTIFLFLLLSLGINKNQEEKLQGKWKLESYDVFSKVLTSEPFMMGTEEQKSALLKEINFALENTYFEFRGDTIIMDDAVNKQIDRKKAIYFLEGDRLVINRVDKIHSKDYRLVEVADSTLVLELVYVENSKKNYAVFKKVN